MTEVRRARGDDDAARAARTLTEAFFEDPILRALVPQDHRLYASLEFYVAQVWMKEGEIYVVEDGAGAACWLGPKTLKVGPFDQLWLYPGMVRPMGQDVPRMMSGVGAIEKDRPRTKHWYLPMIGVVPERQGHGLGSRLLEHMLERLDRKRLPAYLEATTARNRRLYERHGFELVAAERLHGDGPEYWRMWREPGM